jgi:CheY-specific phosphatase CheX
MFLENRPMTLTYPTVEMAEIVGSVFQTMMQVETWPAAAAPPTSPPEVMAVIHLAGGRGGAVVLGCSHAQACVWAGRFLGEPAPPEVDDDVRAVLSELANMVGGNLKGVISPGAQLSMPAVVDGASYRLSFGTGGDWTRQGFDCEQGPFWAAWIESDPAR